MDDHFGTDIKANDIIELFKHFSSKAYSSKGSNLQDERIMEKCVQLWKLDYNCEIVDNQNGSLCSTYPSKIVIPSSEIKNEEILASFPNSISSIIGNISKNECVKAQENSKNLFNASFLDSLKIDENFSNINTENKSSFISCSTIASKYPCNGISQNMHKVDFRESSLREYFIKANVARCRYRFPVPSIFCNKKYISRSATLSIYLDVVGKQMLYNSSEYNQLVENDSNLKSSNDVDKARSEDIKLLEAINTSVIFDLMVEHKKVKFNFLSISSSEKADKENRYSQFSLISIPYPGCEFFSKFTHQSFNSCNLHYNWDAQFNNAVLSLSKDAISNKVTSDWPNYKSWDLRKMTSNYLKLILRYILDKSSKETGFLIHCISGWDRTPLFISLVRMSLWADGLVHSSLSARQMLYFTLAYDWYLFGHQLPERLRLSENILYFCFEFLDEIYADNFLDSSDRRESNGSTNGSLSCSNTAVRSNSESSFESLNESPSGAPAKSGASGGLNNPKNHTLKSDNSQESCNWPFNKENGFSFDGIAENDPENNLNKPPIVSNSEQKNCGRNILSSNISSKLSRACDFSNGRVAEYHSEDMSSNKMNENNNFEINLDESSQIFVNKSSNIVREENSRFKDCKYKLNQGRSPALGSEKYMKESEICVENSNSTSYQNKSLNDINDFDEKNRISPKIEIDENSLKIYEKSLKIDENSLKIEGNSLKVDENCDYDSKNKSLRSQENESNCSNLEIVEKTKNVKSQIIENSICEFDTNTFIHKPTNTNGSKINYKCSKTSLVLELKQSPKVEIKYSNDGKKETVHSNGEVESKLSFSPDPSNDEELMLLRKQASSPHREKSKSSPKSLSSNSTGPGKESSSGSRWFNSFHRDITSSSGRRRKIPITESPDGSDSSQDNSVESQTGQQKVASTPVPVPAGERSRHSSASSVGSWQLLSNSDPTKEMSLGSHRSSKTSLLLDMADSSLTIKEEVTPSSSLDSNQSIIVFHRRRRLKEVREMFLKMYKEEVPKIVSDFSISGMVQNIYQKFS